MTDSNAVGALTTNRASLAKNSFANVARSFATSAVSVLLPIILVSTMSGPNFAAWALVFSVAAYASYFDAGIPAALQSLVARTRANGDHRAERQVAVSGIQVTTGIGLAAVAFSAVLASILPMVSPGMPSGLHGQAGLALIFLGVGQASNLLANTAAAYFSGLQRGMVPTAIIAPARVTSMLVAVVVALFGQDLAAVAIGFALPLLASAVVLVVRVHFATRQFARYPIVSSGGEYGRRGLLWYSGPLILWGLCTLAATGLGTLFVARFAWHELVSFSMAGVVTAAISGLVAALIMPLLPELSRLSSMTDRAVATKLVIAMRVNSAFLFTIGGFAIAALPWYLELVVPDHSQVRGGLLTAALLVTAALLHAAATPLSLGFIATNSHRRLIASPLIQALIAVVGALALAQILGALGVAIAMLVATIVAVLITCFWSVRRAHLGNLSTVTAANWTLFVPAVGLLLPVIACVTVDAFGNATSPVATLVVVAAAVVGGGWQLFAVLPGAERARLTGLIRALRRR